MVEFLCPAFIQAGGRKSNPSSSPEAQCDQTRWIHSALTSLVEFDLALATSVQMLRSSTSTAQRACKILSKRAVAPVCLKTCRAARRVQLAGFEYLTASELSDKIVIHITFHTDVAYQPHPEWPLIRHESALLEANLTSGPRSWPEPVKAARRLDEKSPGGGESTHGDI